MEKLTFTVDEAVQATRLGRDQIRRLVYEGTLPNLGPRTRIRIPRVALERYIENFGNVGLK